MTITINLPPATEQILIAQAKARGVSLEVLLQTIIADQAVAAVAATAVQPRLSEVEDVDRSIDDIFDTVQIPPGSERE